MLNPNRLTWECTIDGHMFRIPDHMRQGLIEYFNQRIKQGSFLHAVLCNDLVGACKAADRHNMVNLPAYAWFLYNFAPIGSYGSKEHVDRWIKNKGGADDQSQADPN